MKLKKKAKLTIIGVALILIIALAAVIVINFMPKKEKVKEIKVLKSIDEYGYELKDNKTKKYKEMFKELEDILREDEVNQEEYAKKVAEMFVYDFYSLEDKVAKTDVGGVDFVHPDALDNFLLNAEDTYYKYIESNIYGERKQDLPAVTFPLPDSTCLSVDTITVESITPTEFAYNKAKHEGYEVKVNWTYTNEKFSSYQKSAVVVLIKKDIKYYVVEI